MRGSLLPAQTRSGIDEERDADRATEPVNLVDRLTGADLGVGAGEHDQSHPRSPDSCSQLGEVDPASRVDRHRVVLVVASAGMGQDNRLVHRSGDQALPDPASTMAQAADRSVEGLSRGGVQGQGPGSDVEPFCKHCASGLEQLGGRAALGVQPPGVTPSGIERSHKRVPGERVQRRGDGVEEKPGGGTIRHARTLSDPAPLRIAHHALL